ncbi:MAG: sulfite exporter TauE/SafE family protein [Geobacteraceae bacterium]|nr:sulfite exporter TauE/SafE family protein [Geobacteraceae bacterium]
MSTEIGLIVLSFFTSALSAVTAAGGGMLLISAMALFLPVNVVIPLHAVTQLISNFSRATLSPGATVWHICLPFLLGIALGVPGAISVYSVYQAKFSALPLGVFVLLMVWIPPGKIAQLLKPNSTITVQRTSGTDRLETHRISFRKLGFGFLGFIQIFITLFVGSSAPLNLPFLLQQRLKRDQLVSTSAMMMTGVSLAKIAIFIAAGFCFSTYVWLMLGLVFAVSVGSWVGTRLRQYIPEKKFARLLKLVLTLLALRLVIVSIV